MVKHVQYFLAAGLLLLAAAPVEAQLIRYDVSWDAPNSHYYNVEMTFTNPEAGSVSVRIPSWRPGRYLIQDYAKNIIGFDAADASGNPLAFHKTDKATWEIDASPGQEVVVTYQAYSRQLDAGASYLDATEAYINPVTMAMYIPGRELEPVVFSVEKPDDWMAATALDYRADMDGYWAVDYHELVDSPFIFSPTLEVLSFELAGTRFEIAIQGEANYDPDQLVTDIRRIAKVQTTIMGVVPFDRYVFLYHFLERTFGHGVEHKNSTSIVVGPADFEDPGFYRRLLGVTSHELWHAWLVERIRPEAIYHPDYSEEAYTTTLWLYEGVTSYYGGLTLRRAGLTDVDAYERGLASTIARFERDPARDVMSVAMTSWDAWIKQREAPPNTYYSFYTAGSVLGLLLDLEVRGRTRNLQSLDDVMRYLYRDYAARDRGVPEDGLQQVLETITNGTFQPFFDAYVYGTESINYDRYLYHVGYRLVTGTDPSRPAAKLGISMTDDQSSVTIESVEPGSGAFEAGLDIDDEIIAIDRNRVYRHDLPGMLHDYSPGDTVSVSVFRRGNLKSFDVVLDGGGNTTYELQRLDDASLLQSQTRRDWLNVAAG